jgi:type I restriction enzyme M protein
VRADGIDPDNISGGGRPETPERNDIPDLLTQWAGYKKAGFKELPGEEGGTLLPTGTDEIRSWWATIKTITENDYNLAAGRYKPQIAEKAPDDDPTLLIQETLAVERDIAMGLEKLLQEVEAVE